MKVKSLENIPFHILLDCFQQSFENYFVKMPTDPEYYRQRWQAAKVRYDLSYGMFDHKKLVGFIINAIDYRNHKWTAYNAATGVLPAYRGKNIAKAIYEYALPEFASRHITHCLLEVITENLPAIKTYERIGFQRAGYYKCYRGKIHIAPKNVFEIKEVRHDDLEWDTLPNQDFYSWDNQKNSLKNGNYKYFFVLFEGKPQSYFVINPADGYLAQFEVLEKSPESWNILFSAISIISGSVRINNVDSRLQDKVHYLEAIGLENVIDQYEMALDVAATN